MCRRTELNTCYEKETLFLSPGRCRESVEENISSKEKKQTSPEKKDTSLRKPTRTREDNIKMGIQGIGCEIRAEGVF
jgi:hypothetical protein